MLFRLFHSLFLATVFCSEVCWDEFDEVYRNQCRNADWQQRYYFDHASMTCKMFWFDDCQSSSRNIFDDIVTCKWLCEEQTEYKSRTCLEPFDEAYRNQCRGGRWQQYFYFDKRLKRCVAFWYDGCGGSSQNLFRDQMTCLRLCEEPARQNVLTEQTTMSPVRASTFLASVKARRLPETVHKTKVENMCGAKSPCLNNATCIFDADKKSYSCKCVEGYTNENCSERIEYDPCSTNPCKNGATCSTKANKSNTTYECFCPLGYGGTNCESRPCDVNPCHNNGTCRATSAFTEFFCECPNGFGGKLCDLEKGSLVKHKYGKNVQLISSGRQEWIDQLKKTKLEELEKKRKVQEGNEEERSLNTSIKSDEEGRGKMKLRQSGKEDDLIIKGFKEQGKQGKSHEMSAIPNHSSKLIQKTDSTVQSVLVGSFAGSIPKTSSTVHVVLEIYFTFLMFS